jgi:hypothetical protein
MAARRIRLPDEDVAGGTSAAHPLEGSGLDELREVVRRLRAANAADLLIRAARQLRPMPVLKDGERPPLRGLQFLSSRSRHFSP